MCLDAAELELVLAPPIRLVATAPKESALDVDKVGVVRSVGGLPVGQRFPVLSER